MVEEEQQAAAQAQASNPKVLNVNEPKTLFFMGITQRT
jgi:hypothetical protein